MPVDPNPVYADLNDEEIDAESPLTESVMTRLRDNSRATFRGDPTVPAVELCTLENQRTDDLNTDYVLQPDGANGLVWNSLSATIGQGQLKTTDGFVARTSNGGANFTLPGGQYGFYPQVGDGAGGDPSVSAEIAVNVPTNESRITNIYLVKEADDTGETRAYQRYVTASPPYDLGDGEIPLFIFAHIDAGKNILGYYVAQDPPWAYNGPTDIRGETVLVDTDEDEMIKTRKGKLIATGRKKRKAVKMRRRIKMQHTAKDVVAGRISAAEFAAQKPIIEMVPLDNAFKNADMGLIPHPFLDLKGKEKDNNIVILDPLGTNKLLELHNAGEDIGSLLSANYLEIEQDELSVKTPNGVKAHKFKWKNTK